MSFILNYKRYYYFKIGYTYNTLYVLCFTINCVKSLIKGTTMLNDIKMCIY